MTSLSYLGAVGHDWATDLIWEEEFSEEATPEWGVEKYVGFTTKQEGERASQLQEYHAKGAIFLKEYKMI